MDIAGSSSDEPREITFRWTSDNLDNPIRTVKRSSLNIKLVKRINFLFFYNKSYLIKMSKKKKKNTSNSFKNNN